MKKKKKTEKELNVFKSPDLEMLKSIYFKSKSYMNDKTSWEKEIALINDAFWQFNRSGKARKTLHYFKNGLRISIKQPVKFAKSTYKKSITFRFNKENWNFRTFSISQAILLLDKTYRTELTLKKVGNDLRIFHKPSIENLKNLYYKTNHYLEGRHGNNEHSVSI